jgi:hypothetical protein
VFHSLQPILVYAEDGAKFFGIFCWAAFHITTLFFGIQNHWDAEKTEAAP